jgi:hypothetical protein
MEIIYNIIIAVLTFIFSVIIGIIGYFVRQTLNDISVLKDEKTVIASDLEVLKNDHLNKYHNLSEKFDELKEVMRDLTKEIKDLNSRIK